MKKIVILAAMLVAVSFGQTVLKSPGPHWLWQSDTLKSSTTRTSSVIHTGYFTDLGIWLKSTNPADSTKYRILFKCAQSLTDTFAIQCDTVGAAGGTIVRISDTLWHYISLKEICAKYTKIYAQALTDHGNRCRIWVRVFLWRPDYWKDFKYPNE